MKCKTIRQKRAVNQSAIFLENDFAKAIQEETSGRSNSRYQVTYGRVSQANENH